MTTQALSVPAAGRSRAAQVGRLAGMLLRRLIQVVIVVVLLVVGTAVLVRLVPGDPASAILGLNATPESLARLRAELGLDQSLPVQVLDQLGAIARGDLGRSVVSGQPVFQVIWAALPVTLSLVVTAIVFALAISLPLGLLPAYGVGRRGIRALRISMVVLIALPSFLIGLYLLLLFSVQLKVAPTGGWSSAWPDTLRYVWLPSLALAIFFTPVLVRSIERSAGQVMGEEYIEAAISRGLPRLRIVARHVLPNTLLPVITLVGFSFTVMIGGAVIIESVYGIPGLGSVIVKAVGQRDYPVIVGVTLFTGILAVVVSLLADVAYALADPRVRTR
jgi:peptide/nickel transport system permease protein